jgi:hypothetical protein
MSVSVNPGADAGNREAMMALRANFSKFYGDK